MRIVVVTTVAVALSWGLAGCAPTAGVLRPSHPLLLSEEGRPALAPAETDQVWIDDPVPDDDDRVRSLRARIARVAGQEVGKGPIVVAGKRFRMDCSGVASGIYEKAGVALGAPAGGFDVRALYALTEKSGSLRRNDPLPGDLVFFDDTWDANGNGLRDDPLSHVAIVERVDDDGTVLLVHRVGRAIVRARMNLAQPHTRHDAQGHTLNHYLRTAQGATPPRTTAELFVAYGSLPLREGVGLVAAR